MYKIKQKKAKKIKIALKILLLSCIVSTNLETTMFWNAQNIKQLCKTFRLNVLTCHVEPRRFRFRFYSMLAS